MKYGRMERNHAWKAKKVSGNKKTASSGYGSMPGSGGTGILFVL